MAFKDSQRYRKVYSYYRPQPRLTDSFAADNEFVLEALRGIDWKQSVRAASTANISNLVSVTSIDGVTLSDEDRVLLKNQSSAEENGIYVFYSASGLVRSLDATTSVLTCGATCYVDEGTSNAGTFWTLTTPDSITVGSTPQTWEEKIGAGGGGGGGGSGNWNELSPSPRLNTTASIAIAGELGSTYAAQSTGTDVFFYVSGTIKGNTPVSSPKVSVFGGDVVTSGSLTVSGTVKIGGIQTVPVYGDVPGVVDAYFVKSYNFAFPGSSFQSFGSLYPNLQGSERGHLGNDGDLSKIWFDRTGLLHAKILSASSISGSITKLSDGTSYLIAGTNINITSQSNGSILIAASPAAGGDGYFYSVANGSVYTTGSVAFSGLSGITSVNNIGSDVFFYVSGSKDGLRKSVFGGDVAVSGTVYGSRFLAGTNPSKDIWLGSASLDQAPGGNISIIAQHGISPHAPGNVLINAGNVDYPGVSSDYVGSVSIHGGEVFVSASNPIDSQHNGKLNLTADKLTLAVHPDGDPWMTFKTLAFYLDENEGIAEVDSKTWGFLGALGRANADLVDVTLLSTSSLDDDQDLRRGITAAIPRGQSKYFSVGAYDGDISLDPQNVGVTKVMTVSDTGDVAAAGYVTASLGFSGSLTRLASGASYLIAGNNVTITSASNGSITISSNGGGGGATGPTGPQGATGPTGPQGDTGPAGPSQTYQKGFVLGSAQDGSGNIDLSSIGTLVPGYNAEADIDVFVNGQLLAAPDDYNMISSTVVHISTTLSSTDIVTVRMLTNSSTPGGIYTPGAPSTSIQFNDGGSFGGSSALTFDKTTNTVTAHDVVPASDSSYSLGSANKRWSNVYTGDLHLRNDRGDWTIVEEEDFLCVVNNKTGKRFKMALIPLEEDRL